MYFRFLSLSKPCCKQFSMSVSLNLFSLVILGDLQENNLQIPRVDKDLSFAVFSSLIILLYYNRFLSRTFEKLVVAHIYIYIPVDAAIFSCLKLTLIRENHELKIRGRFFRCEEQTVLNTLFSGRVFVLQQNFGKQ